VLVRAFEGTRRDRRYGPYMSGDLTGNSCSLLEPGGLCALSRPSLEGGMERSLACDGAVRCRRLRQDDGSQLSVPRVRTSASSSPTVILRVETGRNATDVRALLVGDDLSREDHPQGRRRAFRMAEKTAARASRRADRARRALAAGHRRPSLAQGPSSASGLLRGRPQLRAAGHHPHDPTTMCCRTRTVAIAIERA